MTKEEIALQHGLCTCDKIYTSRGMKAPDCPWHARAVEEAMDAYARQEAAAFAEFINKKKYYQSYITGFWYPTNMEEEAPQLSTNQLYDLYLTYKSQNNG